VIMAVISWGDVGDLCLRVALLGPTDQVVKRRRDATLLSGQQVTIDVHRERRGGVAQPAAHTEDIGAFLNPERGRRVAQRVPLHARRVRDARTLHQRLIAAVEVVGLPRRPGA
jgi:hypothetical protein